MVVDSQSRLPSSCCALMAVSLLLCALPPSRPAWAQAASPANEAREHARARYEQGAHAYSEGRYEDAILHFEAAYALEPAGALLLNIAQANRLKTPADCEAALRHYELYLAAEPRAPERAEVQGQINKMRQCQAEATRKTAAETQMVVPLATTETAGKQSSAGPVWLAAAGGAALIGGGVAYAVARLRFNTLQNQCPCPDDTIDRWEAITNISYVSMAAGAATITAALAWWRLSANDESAQPSSISVAPAPSAWISGRQVALTWQGRFW